MYFTVILRSEATKNIKTLKFCNQTLRSAQGDNSDSRRQIADARFWVVRNRRTQTRQQMTDSRWQILGRRKPPTPTMSFWGAKRRRISKKNIEFCNQTLHYVQGDNSNVILSKSVRISNSELCFANIQSLRLVPRHLPLHKGGRFALSSSLPCVRVRVASGNL